jgi:hypothetical protein
MTAVERRADIAADIAHCPAVNPGAIVGGLTLDRGATGDIRV